MLRESGTSLKVSSGDVSTLALDLHAVAIRLLRQVRQEDDASGLTSARLSVLSVLVFHGRSTLGELARMEQVSLPTMTRLAAALTKAGFVRRSADPDDRRFVYLEATRTGIALLEEGRRRRVRRLSAMLEGLSARELTACRSALGALRRVLS